ncbi:MAG: metal ABC transporter solute-binding protein, Zn/Mn family [Desulfobacteraceae bacterium]
MRWALGKSVCMFAAVFAGLILAPAPAAGEVVKVMVSIPPQAYFVERVGGEHVEVETLVPPGKSPATYEPTSRQMAALSGARVYFRIGVPFEQGLIGKVKRMFPELPVVDTRKGVKLRYFGKRKEGEPPDPHIWLDPGRVKVQALTILETLVELAPDHGDVFEANLNEFHKELDGLDRMLREILKPVRGRPLYVFHPAFGYFCEAYDLKQVEVETEGKEPGPRKTAALIDSARRDGVRVIFVQPQFSRKNARVIAEALSGAIIPIDPLARNYMKNMRDIALAVEEGLSRPGTPPEE